MKIEIYDLWRGGRTVYFWTLYDGPDGIDKVSGYATSLEEVATKILDWRQRIANDYISSLSPDELGQAVREAVGSGPSGGSEHGDHRPGVDGDPEAGPEH